MESGRELSTVAAALYVGRSLVLSSWYRYCGTYNSRELTSGACRRTRLVSELAAEHATRGGHSHTRNAFGRDRGHKVVTETLAIFLVVTGSQDISGSGHGVTGIFLGAVCIILISDSYHCIQHSLAMHTYSHASEEHVRLIMRVEHASALKRVRLGALSARPAPLPITYSCMRRGKEQFAHASQLMQFLLGLVPTL